MNASYIVLLGLILLAIVSVGAAVDILIRGRLYRRIKPEARPRRWVLFLLLLMFTAFALWFPIWMLWPQSLLAKTLGLAFAVIFGVGGLTLKWLTGLVDAIYKRKRWQLR